MVDSGKHHSDKGKSTAQFDVLPNAEIGKVVTRFPPEPSGYLHIGHVKAAMLNYHYCKHYNGKMLLRFDDTNPAKEKEEYVENIFKDLKSLGITWDSLSYTSDYFDMFSEMMTKMISEGNAYADNTDVSTMREERTKGIPSKCRDVSIEDNLKIWSEMIGPNPSEEIKKYCIRGKIDYQNPNKCLRDPVFYRFSDLVHHRVGDKYKIFPCYDFACPIIDSIEGVTHALRTNEYNDRIAMYQWVQKTMKLREVIIYEFSRLNLIHTVLSKRGLKWFVENHMVDGWTDPRFPTVQGILRRGIVPAALKDFMLEQGPSKNTNLMEWDKIYAINRNYIDPIAKRLFAVSAETGVELVIENMNDDEVVESNVDWHTKNKELGTRIQFRTNRLLIEMEDAKGLVEGQKLTLYRWGNSIVTKLEMTGDKLTKVICKLTPDDTNFKGSTVIHWVPLADKLSTNVLLVEFGHLITVKKLEEDTKIEDVVNHNSCFETLARAEIAVTEMKQGDFIQFERRGYFYVDKEATDTQPMRLHYIPDGKAKTQSNIAGKVDVKTITKGEGNEDESKKKKEKKEKKEKKKEKEKEKKEKKPGHKDSQEAPQDKVEDKVEPKAEECHSCEAAHEEVSQPQVHEHSDEHCCSEPKK